MTDELKTQNANQTPETDEPEVEGHMHPQLAIDLGAAHQRDMLAEADRARQSQSAKSTERDGGMLDKIRRFARRDDS